jgi:serine/threonine-protein kinase SRPK3
MVIDLMIGSLYDIMKKGKCENESYKNGFPIEFINKIIPSLLNGINELHINNIIHGDIKPENILVFGITKKYQNMLKKLLIKTSDKKISELIRYEMKNDDIFVTSDSDSSDSSDERPNTDNYTINENNRTNSSLMSDDPTQIELTDSDIDSNDVQEEKKDTIENKFIIPLKYIKEPIIKFADLGSCVFIDNKNKPNNIQTKYYRAPEIILGLEYTTACDLWALGCTLYELVTGDILFNPDDTHDIDDKRCILSKIYNTIGPLPIELINRSPLKQVFFTDNNILKINIYDKEDDKNIFLKLCEKGVHFSIVSVICDLLKVNPVERFIAFN